MNHVPFPCRFTTTRTGLRIGSAYVAPPQPTSRDQERIQAALLEPRTHGPLSALQRLLGAVWRVL